MSRDADIDKNIYKETELKCAVDSGLLDQFSLRVFSDRHATVYGGPGPASWLNQVFYWYKKTIANKDPHEDGQFWFYKSNKEWLEEFGWLTERTLQRYVKYFSVLGIISKKNVKKKSWYTIHIDRLAEDFQQKCNDLNIQDEFKEKAKGIDKKVVQINCIPYEKSLPDYLFTHQDERQNGGSLGSLRQNGGSLRQNGGERVPIPYITNTTHKNTNMFERTNNIQKCLAKILGENHPDKGVLNFEQLWDFYHELTDQKKGNKYRWMEKIKDIGKDKKEKLFSLIVDYFLMKKALGQDIAHKFSNFLDKLEEIELKIVENRGGMHDYYNSKGSGGGQQERVSFEELTAEECAVFVSKDKMFPGRDSEKLHKICTGLCAELRCIYGNKFIKNNSNKSVLIDFLKGFKYVIAPYSEKCISISLKQWVGSNQWPPVPADFLQLLKSNCKMDDVHTVQPKNTVERSNPKQVIGFIEEIRKNINK